MMHGSSEPMLGAQPLGHHVSDEARGKVSASILLLSDIWQRVLNRPSLTADDNFFELGGDPPLAYKLFDEIARVSERELPPSLIYDAPTIAALADVLDRPAPPLLSPFILLKPGTEKPPVFIAHGLGSSVMEFFELIKHMRTSRAIYGFRAKGSDGADQPLTRIEDMAQFHLDALRSVQPHGPYILIGYSLGGVTAFEMARQLSASGEKVALLAMIDSYPRTESLALWKRVHLVTGQARYRTSDAMRSLGQGRPRAPLIHVRERARFSDFLAWTRYRPGFYSGKVKFVRAEDSYYPDPVPIWARLAAEFEVETTPGDHHTSLSMQSERLASLLSRYLNVSF